MDRLEIIALLGFLISGIASVSCIVAGAHDRFKGGLYYVTAFLAGYYCGTYGLILLGFINQGYSEVAYLQPAAVVLLLLTTLHALIDYQTRAK